MIECLVYLKCFSSPIELIMQFFYFNLLVGMTYFLMLNELDIAELDWLNYYFFAILLYFVFCLEFLHHCL